MTCAEWMWDVIKLIISVLTPVSLGLYIYWHARYSEAKMELSSYLHGILFQLRDSGDSGLKLLIAVRQEHWMEIHKRYQRVHFWTPFKSNAEDIWKRFQGLHGVDTTNWTDYAKGMKTTFKSKQDLWDRIQALLQIT